MTFSVGAAGGGRFGSHFAQSATRDSGDAPASLWIPLTS